MKTIKTNSLEIFKQNEYYPYSIGMVSNNAYLSIVATNKCQCACPYCINSMTDHSLDLPIDKAVINMKKLVDTYHIKEAIILGGEPLLHPEILTLIARIRKEVGFETLRLTTNGIFLNKHRQLIPLFFDKEIGLQGINISCHNGKDFMSYNELKEVCNLIKEANSDIKIRINSNIYDGNLDTVEALQKHIDICSEFCDEFRISNIISKDSFSVNPIETGTELKLSEDKYKGLFTKFMENYSNNYTIFENPLTLGFVRYFLIPTKKPIIINWNIGSEVAKQICENDIENRKVNTFKCLVSGNISLSWNESNTIIS